MTGRSEHPESGSSSAEAEPARGRRGRESRRRKPGPTGVVAIGFIQLVSLVGTIGVAVAVGAILVDSAKVSGWIVGLVIGAGSVILTMLVLFSGRHARRH